MIAAANTPVRLRSPAGIKALRLRMTVEPGTNEPATGTASRNAARNSAAYARYACDDTVWMIVWMIRSCESRGNRAEESAGATHGDAVHPQGRLADADRHALAVLAAGADAGIEFHVVADHGDALQIGRSVADQHGALERRAELAVLDLVRFGDVEHVLARRDIDLAAAEVDAVHAVLHRGDDLARIAVARGHVGVGHARHRDVGVTLAPSV